MNKKNKIFIGILIFALLLSNFVFLYKIPIKQNNNNVKLELDKKSQMQTLISLDQNTNDFLPFTITGSYSSYSEYPYIDVNYFSMSGGTWNTTITYDFVDISSNLLIDVGFWGSVYGYVGHSNPCTTTVYVNYTDGSKTILYYHAGGSHGYHTFSLNASLPSDKIVDSFSLNMYISTASVVSLDVRLFQVTFNGYVPEISDVIYLSDVKQGDTAYFSADLLNINSTIDQNITFYYVDTGNQIDYIMDTDWTENSKYWKSVSFATKGMYFFTITARNSWNYTVSSNYTFQVGDYPLSSYLSLFSSVDGFPLQAQNYKTYLGFDEEQSIVDFRTYYGNWSRINVSSDVTYSLIDNYLQFNTTENGLKTNTEDGEIYDTQVFNTLSFNARFSQNTEMTIIYNPEYYEKDYDIEISINQSDVWLSFFIPFFHFNQYQNVTNDYLEEIGFWIANGTVQLSEISITQNYIKTWEIENATTLTYTEEVLLNETGTMQFTQTGGSIPSSTAYPYLVNDTQTWDDLLDYTDIENITQINETFATPDLEFNQTNNLWWNPNGFNQSLNWENNGLYAYTFNSSDNFSGRKNVWKKTGGENIYIHQRGLTTYTTWYFQAWIWINNTHPIQDLEFQVGELDGSYTAYYRFNFSSNDPVGSNPNLGNFAYMGGSPYNSGSIGDVFELGEWFHVRMDGNTTGFTLYINGSKTHSENGWSFPSPFNDFGIYSLTTEDLYIDALTGSSSLNGSNHWNLTGYTMLEPQYAILNSSIIDFNQTSGDKISSIQLNTHSNGSLNNTAQLYFRENETSTWLSSTNIIGVPLNNTQISIRFNARDFIGIPPILLEIENITLILERETTNYYYEINANVTFPFSYNGSYNKIVASWNTVGINVNISGVEFGYGLYDFNGSKIYWKNTSNAIDGMNYSLNIDNNTCYNSTIDEYYDVYAQWVFIFANSTEPYNLIWYWINFTTEYNLSRLSGSYQFENNDSQVIYYYNNENNTNTDFSYYNGSGWTVLTELDNSSSWEREFYNLTDYNDTIEYFAFNYSVISPDGNPNFTMNVNTISIRELSRITVSNYRLLSLNNRQNPENILFDIEEETLAITDFFGTVLYREKHNYSSFIDIALPISTLTFYNWYDQSITVQIERGLGVEIEFLISPRSSVDIRVFSTSYQLYVRDTYDQLIYYEDVSVNQTNSAWEFGTYQEPIYINFYDPQNNIIPFETFQVKANYTNTGVDYNLENIYSNILIVDRNSTYSIMVYDRFSTLIKNQTFQGDIFADIQIDLYTLKIYNQRAENFIHINITYETAYWSEWLAPFEIGDYDLVINTYNLTVTLINGTNWQQDLIITQDDILLIADELFLYSDFIGLAEFTNFLNFTSIDSLNTTGQFTKFTNNYETQAVILSLTYQGQVVNKTLVQGEAIELLIPRGNYTVEVYNKQTGVLLSSFTDVELTSNYNEVNIGYYDLSIPTAPSVTIDFVIIVIILVASVIMIAIVTVFINLSRKARQKELQRKTRSIKRQYKG